VIGRGHAVADIWSLRFGGFPAWLIWIFVHIFFLIGFRNRVMVLLEWAWSYLTYQRGARIITWPWHPGPQRAPIGITGNTEEFPVPEKVTSAVQ
jgi:NADH dehydrogenase